VSFLLDSNILLRLVEPAHPMHTAALDACTALLGAGEAVHVIPQNISEFWNVCTRPVAQNGLGFSSEQTNMEVSRLESLFELLLDQPGLYREWRRLVVQHAVKGVKVHDARIVAAMNIHGISHLVTFDEDDFRRYQDITVMTPAHVISGA
jgi:predicted nucleic acid-binding protein